MYEDVTAAKPIDETFPPANRKQREAGIRPAPREDDRLVVCNPNQSCTGHKPCGEASQEARSRTRKPAEPGTRPAPADRGPVRTPDRQWWFRCHRDSAMTVPVDLLIIRSGPDEGTYFLDPDIEFPDELDQYIVPALLTRSITHDGVEFFFLAKQSDKSSIQGRSRKLSAQRY